SRGRPLRHVLAVDARAVGRPEAGGVDQILDEEPFAGERPPLGRAGVDPRDDGVQVVFHRPLAERRSWEIVARGLIASGSTRSASTAGQPEATASSKAASTASVRCTVLPWQPNDRAYA